MTREEAIECLKTIQRWTPDWDDREDGLSYWDAIDMALSALRPVSREQVERERDAAVSDLTFVVNQYRLETTGIDLCGLCEYDLPPVGENGQTAECPGFYVNDCFKWRGPEEG
jgi:hypothetical protein